MTRQDCGCSAARRKSEHSRRNRRPVSRPRRVFEVDVGENTETLVTSVRDQHAALGLITGWSLGGSRCGACWTGTRSGSGSETQTIVVSSMLIRGCRRAGNRQSPYLLRLDRGGARDFGPRAAREHDLDGGAGDHACSSIASGACVWLGRRNAGAKIISRLDRDHGEAEQIVAGRCRSPRRRRDGSTSAPYRHRSRRSILNASASWKTSMRTQTTFWGPATLFVGVAR